MDDCNVVGGKDTCWVFISDSDEVRHLYDIIHSVSVLRGKGVSLDAIKIFTNFQYADMYTSPFSCPQSFLLNDLPRQFSLLKECKHIVITVTGHGRIDGVGALNTAFQPSELVSSVRAIPDLCCGIIVLCQCYAGIFNFMDASSKPPVVLVGATNLNSSLSPPISLSHPLLGTGDSKLEGWHANAFMFYFFKWLQTPIDIDGDGCASLIDAYKYAGSASTSEISSIKTKLFIRAQELSVELLTYKEKAKLAPVSLADELKSKATNDELTNLISIINVNQEPWLLHANLARRLLFS